ncbi:hypothetical protein FRC07_008657 [Ceratobasidium sp. 392]|nr:hypothetical protein FRC07_008657 [Ceratobasidium sp. 392]
MPATKTNIWALVHNSKAKNLATSNKLKKAVDKAAPSVSTGVIYPGRTEPGHEPNRASPPIHKISITRSVRLKGNSSEPVPARRSYPEFNFAHENQMKILADEGVEFDSSGMLKSSDALAT